MNPLESIRTASDGLVTAARAVGVDAPVPSCPDWDIHALVLHTGSTQRWATTIVSTGATTYVPADPGVVPTERNGIFDWFDEGSGLLLDVLAHADPDAPVWSWGRDQHVRFWSRRMVHETAVHGWDAGAAAGNPRSLPADVAVDGVDEMFENLQQLIAFRSELASLRGNGETVHLHATDADGEWLIRLTPDGIETSREHAKGDVAARGSASDLMLFVVGRVRPAQLEVFGDSALLERWQNAFKF